ncbi:DUF4190 domain-containing protein [Microbacterium panaciterrae]
MSNDQGGYPQNPGQQPPPYPGAPVPPQQQPAYPGAAPAPQAPVPPAPAYPGAAPTYPGAAPAAPGYAPPGAPAYGQPYAQPYGQPYATPKKSNGLAITALICGIAGVVLCIVAYLVLPFLASVAAIITGHMSLGRIKRDPELGGKGLGITGLVLGYVGAALNLIIGGFVIIGLIFAISQSGSSY